MERSRRLKPARLAAKLLTGSDLLSHATLKRRMNAT